MRFIEAFIYCFGSLKGTAGSALLCRTLRRLSPFFIYLLTLGMGPLPTVEIILKNAIKVTLFTVIGKIGITLKTVNLFT